MGRSGRAIGVLAGLIVVLVGLGLVVAGEPATGFEQGLTRWARGLPDLVADLLWAPMQLGTVRVALAAAVVLALGLGWRAGARAVLAVVVVWLTSRRLKLAFDRPRLTAEALGAAPREAVHSPAYPSSHAAVAFALATSVALVDRRWGRVAYALAGLVALGRMVAGVHTLADLVGGAALGAVAAFTIHLLDRALDHAATRRTAPTP